MKAKFLIIIGVIVVLTCGISVTYSFFTSSSTLSSDNLNIAKFIFNAQQIEELELPLSDLKPGDTKEYLFSVSNNVLGNISKVLIEYQLTIKTFHLMPLVISLYSVDDDKEELVMNCDESYTRNVSNELICNGPVINMGFKIEEYDNYKLIVDFPSEYNSEIYSNLVDYISLEINSWQKLES